MGTKNSSTKNVSPFTQTNAFAMQHGIILGILLIILLGTLVMGLTDGTASLISTILVVAYPIIVGRLTFSFRRIISPIGRFTIFQGFMHALLSMFYAAIWGAIATYIYMRFFDNGHFVNTLVSAISNPQTQELLKANGLWQITQGQSDQSLLATVNQMQNIPPSLYAEMILYMNITLAPITALIIGLCTMRFSSSSSQ